jgi:hypothetical protein
MVFRKMKEYSVPADCFFRLHHIRPRFKNNVEEVLLFVASEISCLKELKKEDFDKTLNKLLRKFPGNQVVSEKTINNWRTEISSLFGFILYNPKTGTEKPSPIAIKLSENQDLVEFFKFFCFSFQYPGGHLKTQEIKKIIDLKIRFKPVQFILKLLKKGKETNAPCQGINKAEATHLIFNDLRATRGEINETEVLKRLEKNRKDKISYDWTGDVIRYAGDILDYMYYANLLKQHGGYYFINESESAAINFFIKHSSYFEGFEAYYKTGVSPSDLRKPQIEWFNYLTETNSKTKFETDVLSYLGLDISGYKKLEKLSSALNLPELRKEIGQREIKTKEIGDTGESLIHGHECTRLKNGGRQDLIDKVVCIPNYLKLGYDIRSFELDQNLRCIEVKTTISNAELNFRKFNLTPNEWNVADKTGDQYYIYRLVITRNNIKLFIIRNPVKEYKHGAIKMESVANGVEISFTDKSGHYEDLLKWGN